MFTIIRIIQLITLISSDNCPSWDIGNTRFSPTQGSFRSLQLFGAGTHQVSWCSADILQSVSCQKNSMAVTDWTLSLFGRQESTMVLLLCRQIQSGMPEYCSCFQPLLRRTLDPSPSTVHLCRQWNLLWKHMTILKMVGLCIYALHILYVLYVLNALFFIIHIKSIRAINQVKSYYTV